jgi:predicted nucleic-acid-binding protein
MCGLGMRAVDTNVLVRLITRDDAAQLAGAERFVEAGAWVSHLALVETVWVLDTEYSRSAADIATAIELLLGHRQLILQDADVVASALEQFRARPGIGFSDCLLLETARRAGHLPLGTFDPDLSRRDGTQKIDAGDVRGK